MDWQQFLNRILASLITLSDVLMVFMQTLIISFGTMILMALLLWVEQDAVSHGVAVYEAAPDKAAAAAAILVLFNFAVKFWEVYIEDKARDQRTRYRPDKQYAFSLRNLASSLLYFLGIGKGWKRRELSPATGFAHIRRVITVTMLCLAFIGRTHDAIQKVSVIEEKSIAWQQGLGLIFANSTLADITVWITALIFTFAAVIAAQRLTQYIAVRVVEIMQRLSAHRTVKQSRRQPETQPAQLAYENPRDLSPILVKVGSVNKRRCPQCGKIMSRQAWQKHPCRFTEGYAAVDALVDGDNRIALTDGKPIRQHVNSSVNGHSQPEDG